MLRSYNELIMLDSFIERYRYLELNGRVCEETFGFDRWMNQVFYRSEAWKQKRHEIIIRDNGCDLGVQGYTINGRIYIHHMNPIRKEFIDNISELLNDEYLICTSFNTHQCIHYGNGQLLEMSIVERRPNDTCPWKQ